MRPQVYVHVGCRKTGTSFLQRTIYRSKDALAEQGLTLPLPDRPTHNALVFKLIRTDDQEPLGAGARRRLDRLASVVTTMSGGRGLISHESLAQSTPRQVNELLGALDSADVHIVISARDWARQIPSEWQQSVKERYLLPYGAFVAAVRDRQPAGAAFWARQDVVDVATRWGASVPPDRVHIVTVPPSGAPSQLLLERFCGLIGCAPATLSPASARNPSLGIEQAELLRRVNVALGDRLVDIREEYQYVVRQELASDVLGKQDGTKLTLPPDLAGWCHDVAQQSVDVLRSRGYDVVGELADLVPPDRSAADSEDGVLDVTDAQVAQAAVEALATIAVNRNTERRREQRRKAKRESGAQALPDGGESKPRRRRGSVR